MDEIREMRLVLTAQDHQAVLRFYRDDLGLKQLAEFDSPDGHVTLLEAGRATIEIMDPANAAFVDEVEVGRRVAGPIRVAFHVSDATAATRRLRAAGAEVIAEPTQTPWNSLNARIAGLGGLQLTLFEDLNDPAH